MREQDKHFLASLYAAVAVIFAWKGLWEGIYEIPYVGEPFVFLFIGFAMLTFSGVIFNEFDPLGSVEKSVQRKINEIINHPNKNQFTITCHDKHKGELYSLSAKSIYKIEGNSMIIKENRYEKFIPLHRIREIKLNGEQYWKF
ncbi:hypothetical protein COV17_04070 [Candidatus Woesearchaeota archaeon CG10_big_fil_rev_8_21_14_0_10_36_11]|nr:MAG: hypothetical protein COV17_04070 [Candidatus Woesearchaeota archaeon CG10_big_fil_rev_8_21_14_0_10_36_11]